MNCPVCLSPESVRQCFRGTDRFLNTTVKTFEFHRCLRCGSLLIDPMPTGEELAKFYPARYWWSSSRGRLNKLESIYRRIALRDHVAFVVKASESLVGARRPMRLLDVGCGGATLLGVLKTRGFDVRGFDTSLEAAAIARADYGVEVTTGESLREGNFPNSAFDVVTLFHVIEHVPDPRDLLAEVRRILQSHGRVILQAPNIESWQARLLGARWHGLDVPRHVINYSGPSMRRLVSDLGFRVRRIRHFNFRDNAPALASSLFPALDPVGRQVQSGRSNGGELGLLPWVKHALYTGAVACAFPFAMAESLAGFGATVMMEAEKV